MTVQPLSPQAPPAAEAPKAPTVGWTREEFDLLAVRVANEPARVEAAVALFTAKLINFTMLKDMLDIR
jgi:hypothetical protein